MLFKVREGSTAALIQLCLGYFIFYVITGITVKYFLSTGAGFPAMKGMEFLVYSTAGGVGISLLVVMILKWYRFESVRFVHFAGLRIPHEFLYIIPSGFFTAIVVPTTTLMYSFEGISVMMAMVLMRGSVIIIGRVVDEIQIRQGILKKKVYAEENTAVVIAMGVVGMELLLPSESHGSSPFSSVPVMVIFISYILAYLFRIYIMNYYKNTRPKGEQGSNKGFFAIEQITATTFIVLATIIAIVLLRTGVINAPQVKIMDSAITSPVKGLWIWAVLAGVAYGIVSFFSVFIFMFKGRTATFAGLVNRVTSLIAGTTATLLFAVFFNGKYPAISDWVSLGMIFLAVYFMTKSEKKRALELAAEKEI